MDYLVSSGNENILMCDINHYYTKYGFAPKGIKAEYLNNAQLICKVHLKNESILDRVTFDTISYK